MFNFHKPRTYRSAEGCCICKAKSSSSRFADSRKYEKDTMQCFDLKYPRQGEICNACVLLIKRFKRLPVGSKRNWSHIVDAKAAAGPGYNKIQTKSKSERINAKAISQQNQGHASSSSSSSYTNNNNGVSTSGSSLLNGMCFIPERFSKIFKKSKKLKEPISHTTKRKTNNNGWSQSSAHSLPTTPDSLDSDYEDARISASLSNNPGSSTVVQFQTQTRASAYKAQAAAEAKKRIIKLGTKRRKSSKPRKNSCSTIYEESLPFFDEEEWSDRKSCCGIFYECESLAGALLVDITNYKPCEQHKHRIQTCQNDPKQNNAEANIINSDLKNLASLPLAKSSIQTIPAMVQLQPPQGPPSSALVPSSIHTISSNVTNNSFKTTATAATTPTPVLKKHHLFFKRQSECFPQGDMVTSTNNFNNAYTVPNYDAKIVKTESDHHHNQTYHNQQNPQSSTILQKHIENAIQHSNSSINPPTTLLTNSLTSLPLSISVTSSVTVASSSVTNSAMPQMPKHSLAKVTTISPPLTTSINQTHHHYNPSANNGLPLAKPGSFLHKLKADSGKIVKHSIEKFNSAAKLKTSDMNDMKPLIRTVDKSYILAKPPTQANIVSYNATTSATSSYQSLASYNAASQPFTTTSISAASPTSSTSSTSSTKFSDNSSDSGFDENMLDRKSASPLQEDCEKKLLSRPGVQTMFLASGVQIQSQPQNLILNGNDVAAKILQNRKYNNIATNSVIPNPRTLTSNHQPTTTPVKIAQISTNLLTSTSVTSNVCPPISMSSAAQAKMRAIYNNNNTIQHENGITTIVPASSLAASTQTAAMQNIAPSTVTITPAPPMGTQYNTQNVISRKLTTGNIINLQSNTTNLGNSHNNINGNHHHHLSSSGSSTNNNNHNATNQKIILLKTSPNNTPTVTTTANYNTLTGGGQFVNNGSGR